MGNLFSPRADQSVVAGGRCECVFAARLSPEVARPMLLAHSFSIKKSFSLSIYLVSLACLLSISCEDGLRNQPNVGSALSLIELIKFCSPPAPIMQLL